MSYIKFDKTSLNNLDRSLPREFLQVNKNGAYISSSVVDCNTRKYHGCLVAPVPDIDGHNHVLLSSVDETVIQHGAEFNIGIRRYDQTHFAPRGHKYIREFDADTVPTTVYRIGGVILKKERLIMQDKNTVLIRYTLVEAHSQTTVRLKPFLAFRDVHSLTHENTQIHTAYEEVDSGISMCLYDKYPRLYLQTSRQAKFIYEPHWNKNIEYPKEQERGLYYKEDLFVAGYFEFDMKTGESIVFAAGVEAMSPRSLKSAFAKELARIRQVDSFKQALVNASKQFFVERDGDTYILAGFPCFKFSIREALLSLSGSTLSLGDISMFDKCISVILRAINEYLSDEEYTTYYTDLYVPDAPLWLIWNLQQYAKHTSIEATADKYGDEVLRLIDFIRQNKCHNLHIQPNGLLYTDGSNMPATWMNAIEDQKPITPRTGYVVEFNALWYNALCFGVEIAQTMDRDQTADMLRYQASVMAGEFQQLFWNGSYLYDFVVDGYSDPEVRPNMIYAISLPYSPLKPKQQKSVLDFITRELLTVKGLRSLSPKSGMYRPKYIGGMYERNRNYHNGPVWAFTIGAYAEAYLKIYGHNATTFIRRFLAGFEADLKELTVGTLSELFDGNPPFKGHGAMSYAPTISEVLRTVAMIE